MSMFDLGNEEIRDGNSRSFLKPGLNIPVILESIEIDDKENLKISFKGIGEDKGSFTHTFWANVFDTSDEKYNEINASNEIAKIKHVIKAFLTEEETKLVVGKNWMSLCNKIINTLKPFFNKELELLIKVVYTAKSDIYCTFPKFPNFISSKLRPLPLTLDGKINNTTGLPFDRIYPMANFGIKPDVTNKESLENSDSESTTNNDDLEF